MPSNGETDAGYTAGGEQFDKHATCAGNRLPVNHRRAIYGRGASRRFGRRGRESSPGCSTLRLSSVDGRQLAVPGRTLQGLFGERIMCGRDDLGGDGVKLGLGVG
jgi:hypothetical protein